MSSQRSRCRSLMQYQMHPTPHQQSPQCPTLLLCQLTMLRQLMSPVTHFRMLPTGYYAQYASNGLVVSMALISCRSGCRLISAAGYQSRLGWAVQRERSGMLADPRAATTCTKASHVSITCPTRTLSRLHARHACRQHKMERYSHHQESHRQSDSLTIWHPRLADLPVALAGIRTNGLLRRSGEFADKHVMLYRIYYSTQY